MTRTQQNQTMFYISVRSILSCLFLAATQFSVTAYATLIAPATVTGTLSAPVLDGSFGALDAAYKFGGVDLTRDGIAFSGISSPDGNPITLSTTPFTLGMTGGLLGNAPFGSDLLFGNAAGALGTPFAVINVLASGTTSLQYEMPTNGPRGPSMSGLVISSVP